MPEITTNTTSPEIPGLSPSFALSPGIQLDLLVAEKVMSYRVMRSFKDFCHYVVETDHEPTMNSGYPCLIAIGASCSQSVPAYSTNDNLAFDVLKKLGELGHVVLIKYDGRRIANRYTILDVHFNRLGPDRDKFAQAICEAALAIVSRAE